jgi:hypothetical protein
MSSSESRWSSQTYLFVWILLWFFVWFLHRRNRSPTGRWRSWFLSPTDLSTKDSKWWNQPKMKTLGRGCDVSGQVLRNIFAERLVRNWLRVLCLVLEERSTIGRLGVSCGRSMSASGRIWHILKDKCRCPTLELDTSSRLENVHGKIIQMEL